MKKIKVRFNARHYYVIQEIASTWDCSLAEVLRFYLWKAQDLVFIEAGASLERMEGQIKQLEVMTCNSNLLKQWLACVSEDSADLIAQAEQQTQVRLRVLQGDRNKFYSISVNLEPELFAWMMQQSQANHLTLSPYVRRLIVHYLGRTTWELRTSMDTELYRLSFFMNQVLQNYLETQCKVIPEGGLPILASLGP
jgi:plasmid maintenance system killer protein